ncbi:DUF308 domain-containing protein [Raoultibacter phocaeensis]|uniref:DUF308 domain-containing protein n=1 Tax=Raoultibacter phocaeensis TaxID=2479841 RepID=UPI00111B80E4|nr:DUF308 domain-containing protein [Raoultibacter phocaeensis]
MTEVRSIKELRSQSNAGKLSIVALLVLPLLGLLCLFWPEESADFLPYALGGVMVLSGIGGIIVEVSRARKEGDGNADAQSGSEDGRKDHKTAGTSIVMCVLGAVILVHGASSISFVGVMWGLLGLFKAAGEFDEIIHRIKNGRRFVLKLAFSIFELVLSVLLILHPFSSIDHHMILLGLELITYPFKIDRTDNGKFTLEAEA